MGRFLAKGEWDRDELVITTKVIPMHAKDFGDVFKNYQGLSRKNVVHNLDKSL